MLRTVTALLFVLLISTFCLPARSCACPRISTIDASERMVTLANDIRYHNLLYYEKAQPLISDAEYDRLLASLIHLEECFPAQVAAALLAAAQDQPLTLSSADARAVRTIRSFFHSSGGEDLLVKFRVQGIL